MIRHVVVRYSSLGDVILAASVTGALGDVAFVTEPRYHELVRRFPGVVQALAPDDPVPAGARIIDLHHNLRSARVAADVRVQRTDFRRRARVWLKVPPGPSVVQRYGRAAGVTPSPPPWLPPIVRGTALILAPGAAHATKRWPWFVPLARAWDGPVRAVGGVADQPIVDVIGGVAEAGFAGTLAAMEGGAVLCGGDTGILHLAAAVGLPVVGLFGPTTSDDGFWQVAYGEAVEHPLSCRPCSRFGGDVCPIGDHRCLIDVGVDEVLAACRRRAAR